MKTILALVATATGRTPYAVTIAIAVALVMVVSVSVVAVTVALYAEDDRPAQRLADLVRAWRSGGPPAPPTKKPTKKGK